MRPNHDIDIRPLRRTDREAVREILRRGAQRGDPLSNYIDDEEIVLRLFVDYYFDHELDRGFAAVRNGEVVGFIVVSFDTRRYNRIVATRIVPGLLLRVLWKTLTLQYRSMKTYRILWWCLTRARREVPGAPEDRYPAHVHLTIAEDSRGFGLGRALVDAAARLTQAAGIPGGHGIVLEEKGRNLIARVLGAEVAEVRPATVWKHCSDKEWEFKLLLMDLRR